MDGELLTVRLRLRRFVPGDVERLLELDSDPAVMRYLTGGRATSRAELERDYLPAFLAPAASFSAAGASLGAASLGAASSGVSSSGAASFGAASSGVSRGGYGFFAAERRSSSQFVGWFHLRPRPAEPPDEPELGYRLRRAMWGRGYATDGARSLVDRAVVDGGARRVYSQWVSIERRRSEARSP